jgi:hypothetical protein
VSGVTYVRHLANWKKRAIASIADGHFVGIYRPLADEWAVYDNSGQSLKLLERWP